MKTLFLLLVVFPSTVFSQVLPLPPDADKAIAGMVNFQGKVALGISDLIRSVAPSIMPFGWTLLALFGACALLQTLLHGTMRSFSAYHYHPLATVAAYVAILFRIAVAATMLSFYLEPIPGLSINFHQLFPALAQGLANSITTDLLKRVLGNFNDSLHFLPPVGMFQVLPALLTIVLLVVIAASQVALTIITAGSLAIVGMLTLCGPLMIPFYVLPGHEKRFWTWFDNMLAYSMYVFVGAGFTFIFCHAYLDFFSTMHGFGVGQWIVSLPYLLLITTVFLWTMFRVPEITHILFGGMGGVAQGFASTLQGLAVKGAMKMMG